MPHTRLISQHTPCTRFKSHHSPDTCFKSHHTPHTCFKSPSHPPGDKFDYSPVRIKVFHVLPYTNPSLPLPCPQKCYFPHSTRCILSNLRSSRNLLFLLCSFPTTSSLAVVVMTFPTAVCFVFFAIGEYSVSICVLEELIFRT